MKVVALLRGVNVGRGRRLAMADLRETVSSLGHRDVTTYLQSGNVVFVPAPSIAVEDVAPAISAALEPLLGRRVEVLVRTAAEMGDVVAASPYQRDDPTKLTVMFFGSTGEAGRLATFDPSPFAPEGFTVHGREVYFDLPFGQARSKLLEAVGKAAPAGAAASTTRNWRTVLALADLVGT